MDERRFSVIVAGVIVMLVLAVIWDVSRRSSVSRRAPAGAGLAIDSVVVSLDTPAAALRAPAGALGQSQSPGITRPTEAGPSHMEMVARAETRRQIRASATLTYLNEIVAASGDSMLHRWDNRVARPVRVHLARSRAANFRPAFLDAVRSAFRVWEEVVPVSFDAMADSADAEVRLRWRVQFEIDRTGQTDLVWNGAGHIESGVVTLATFDPDGQPMGPEEIRLVALHEIGHLLGLDHSPDSGDVMFPVATVGRLSRRDVETARLLYRLAPGSIR
ncbi:MAG: matrixin family metalloprotease [Gemmatimonadales bacterium]